MMKRSFIPIFVVIVFVALSFVLEKPSVNSTELTTITTEDGDTKITSFINAQGVITFASDKGYASIRRTYEDGYVILEEYLDEKGRPVTLPAGYSVISRIYNNGLNTVIAYLDPDLKPVVTTAGYDSIYRTYNENNLADTDTYWIGDNQVERSSGYWRYHRLYDEKKKISEIRYEDQEGSLSDHTTFGYSLIKRSYDGSARIDLYFDHNGALATASLGNYGVKVDGNTTTYLGADGKPMSLSRDYATVIKDGSKTFYYDKEGQPVTIGRNQYGVQSVNGQAVYLDENGEPMVRLDNLLNTHPLAVVALALMLTVIALLIPGKGKILFIVAYIGFILYMTMWHRETGDSRGALTLFWSYRQFLSNPPLRQTIINNVWLFVPLGAALHSYGSSRRWKWLWLSAIVLSICIEIVQWTTGIGLAELDDVISNSIGILIGVGVSYSFRDLIDQIKLKRTTT